MKFGKLADISGVDFSLPPEDPFTRQVLGGQPAPTFSAYIGLSRWASKEWVGNLYPKGAKAREYLYHYARAFNSIELNSTHYRSPSVEQVQKWREQVPPGFRFCPKVPQVISHYRKLTGVEAEVTQFAEAVAAFEDQLGSCFLQLHDSFSPQYFAVLRDFCQRWPREITLALEFRHPDWFDRQQLIPELADLLMQQGLGTVITDVAGRRDVAHGTLTSRQAMIRLVGNSLDPTDYTRSAQWLQRIATWQAAGLEHLYLFPHEPGDLMAAKLGKHWAEGLNQAFDLQLTIPDLDPAGGQMALF